LRPIVLQKSPSRLCEIEICNNRIGASVLLNRCCSFVPDLESMFRDQMQKILLQHNPSQSGHAHVASRSPAQKVYILHKKLSLSGALCAKPLSALKRSPTPWREPDVLPAPVR